jgi:hypothetical protein
VTSLSRFIFSSVILSSLMTSAVFNPAGIVSSKSSSRARHSLAVNECRQRLKTSVGRSKWPVGALLASCDYSILACAFPSPWFASVQINMPRRV